MVQDTIQKMMMVGNKFKKNDDGWKQHTKKTMMVRNNMQNKNDGLEQHKKTIMVQNNIKK